MIRIFSWLGGMEERPKNVATPSERVATSFGGLGSLVLALLLIVLPPSLPADESRIHEFPLREEMKLVVNGITRLPGERVAMSSARGEIWILHNPKTRSEKFADYRWNRFASGLNRPARLLGQGESIIVQQQNETSSLLDRDGDGIADQYRVSDHTWNDSPKTFPFRGMIWLDSPEPSGPFAGQYLGGSTMGKHLSRMSIVGGAHYAMYIYQRGLRFPVDAMARLSDGSLIVAQSNRSDENRSRTRFALQRIVPEKEQPFEILKIEQTDLGFRIYFTRQLLRDAATSEWSYKIESLSDKKEFSIKSVKLSKDETSVDLVLESAPPSGRMYHIACNGVWSQNRDPVRNPAALFIHPGE